MSLYARTLVALVLILAGCGGVRPNVDPTRDTSMDGILRLIGKFSSAHACPITDSIALTSAHVIDPRPFDPNVGLYPYRYSTPDGDEGFVANGVVEQNSDLAAVSAQSHPFKRWYQLAAEAPKPGTKLRYMAYQLTKRGELFTDLPRAAIVERVIAGHIVMSVGGPRGSSGSCVLNDRDEVVGVNSWEWGFDSFQQTSGVAVGVWGNWVK